MKAMGTTYKLLFKLYDLIQSSNVSSVQNFLENNSVELNDIIQCKGIGVLHLAVGIDPLEKSKKCTELILKYGADPNLCNDDGITPVHIAAIWGRVDNLKLLIGCGGNPYLRDLDGLSGFDYAVREQQWEVYDYLHNVVDQMDDCLASPCAYSIVLDRILMTTDQMVAEYKPNEETQTVHNGTMRKSQMTRDWCENNLFMNKLYPTILGETYLLENESYPLNDMEFTSMTVDLNHNKALRSTDANDTNISFKTCLSNQNHHDIEANGIQNIEQTVNSDRQTIHSCDVQTNCDKERFSVYENFSLPGSPNCITHTNYNTKCTLKKCKNQGEIEHKSEFRKTPYNNSQSLSTNNKTVDLEKAMAVVQNKRNELISSYNNDYLLETKGDNTRRSSTSSCVSSNFSGGNIVIANIQEEYKYEDKEENMTFIEKRLLISPVLLPLDDADMTSPDQTIQTVASSLPTSVEYDINTLRTELTRLGFNPGPIQEKTKTLYLKKLQALKKNPIVANKRGKTYTIELQKSLQTSNWMNDLTVYDDLEKKARADFANPSKKWREGANKTSFTYLLLDPRITDNLPNKASKQSTQETWNTFINAIFYIGKGKRSRPYSHLYQALTLWKRDFKTSKDKKVHHILDIWSDKVGVICLHVFQNVIPAEAFTYEAAMIDVLGLANLKNLKIGNYYGAVASWSFKERRMLGLYLLYKAMQIFLTEGERQLRPDDID